jgi:uroporphyrinogen decarboxylase
MLSPKEIVNAAFALKKPPRVPVGVCLGGSWPFFIEGVSLQDLLPDPQKAAAVFYRVNERVKADFVTVGTGATAFMLDALGAKITFRKNGAPEIDSLLVETESDLDKLNINQIFKSEKIQWLKAVAEETVRLNQDFRSLFVSGRAPFTLAGQLCGLETLSRAIYKNKPFLEKLINFTTNLSSAYYEFMLKIPGLDGFFIADPSASGDVLSAKHFETVALPGLTEVISRLKPFRKLSLLHICGNTIDRLHLLPQTGLQMVSVDSRVDLKQAKEILNSRLALAGNVHPVFVLEEKSKAEIYEASRQCLVDAAQDGGFMLLPGCDLSAKVPEANVLAFVKAAHDF